MPLPGHGRVHGGVTVRSMEIGFGQVVAALVFVAVLVLAFRASPRAASVGFGALLLVVSGFLLWTLVLEEPFIAEDVNAQWDAAAMIGIPAVLGVGLGAFGLIRRPRAQA